MARPKSEGFSYCQQDTDTFFDPKIMGLIASHGCEGYALWDYIKMAAYREHGFFVEWDEDRTELAAYHLRLSTEKIGLILNYLLRRSLLCCIERKTCTSRSGVKVLTSHGIQKRFQSMAKDCRRTYRVDREIWILSEEETLDCIQVTQKPGFSGKNAFNSGKNAFNSGELPQSKEKTSKEKNNSRRPRVRADSDTDRDDGLSERESEILAFCRDALQGKALDPREKRMILDAAAGMPYDQTAEAICIAMDYGAETADYLAKVIRTQRDKPERRMKGADIT